MTKPGYKEEPSLKVFFFRHVRKNESKYPKSKYSPIVQWFFKLAVRLRTSEASKNRDLSDFFLIMVVIDRNCFSGAFLSFLEVCILW